MATYLMNRTLHLIRSHQQWLACAWIVLLLVSAGLLELRALPKALIPDPSSATSTALVVGVFVSLALSLYSLSRFRIASTTVLADIGRFAAIVCILLLICGLVPYFGPRSLRTLVLCGLSFETVDELPGVYVNGDGTLRNEPLAIAVYDTSQGNFMYMRLGAQEFYREASRAEAYALRVNARSPDKAASLLEAFLRERQFSGTIAEVCILGHGSPARPGLGNAPDGTFGVREPLYELVATYRGESRPRIAFVHCNVAQGAAGADFILQIAHAYDIEVAASESTVVWELFRGSPSVVEPGGSVFVFNQELWRLATPSESRPVAWHQRRSSDRP